jgi:hypothetical protein
MEDNTASRMSRLLHEGGFIRARAIIYSDLITHIKSNSTMMRVLIARISTNITGPTKFHQDHLFLDQG